MARYHEKKVNKELFETYSDKFAYIERVINSCRTHAQLLNAIDWGNNVLYSIDEMECEKRCSAESWAVVAYMGYRRDILDEIYLRKNEELNKFFYENESDKD